MTETREHAKTKRIKTLADLRKRTNDARDGLNDHDGDWAAITVIYPLACEINEILTTSGSFESKQEQLKSNALIAWLNDKTNNSNKENKKQLYGNNFYEAKRKMIKHGFIPSDDFSPSTNEELSEKYILEHICSTIIKFLMHSSNMLAQVPALKAKHKKIIHCMQYIHDEIDTLGTIYFQDEVHMYLLQCSLRKLLTNKKRSVFSSGKSHEDLAREVMIKRTMELIYFYFPDRTITNEFVIDISISITSHFFFPPIERKDVEKIAVAIKQSAYDKHVLMNKSVKDLLCDYANEQTIFSKFDQISKKN